MTLDVATQARIDEIESAGRDVCVRCLELNLLPEPVVNRFLCARHLVESYGLGHLLEPSDEQRELERLDVLADARAEQLRDDAAVDA